MTPSNIDHGDVAIALYLAAPTTVEDLGAGLVTGLLRQALRTDPFVLVKELAKVLLPGREAEVEQFVEVVDRMFPGTPGANGWCDDEEVP